MIARPSDLDGDSRRTLYREYGAFITSLRGCYVTAEDAGTRSDDMLDVFYGTRFTTCIPESVGGSGNPSFATARGVVCAAEAAFNHLGAGTLEGKTVAMQGVGNVGRPMVGELLERRVARLIATDISPGAVEEARKRFPDERVKLELVEPGDHRVLEAPCDLLAPNGLGGVLSGETIPSIRARVVCGAANNQLLDERVDAQRLHERGILYVPDFVANRMGIVQCANEQYGSLPGDPAIERHLGRDWSGSVYQTTLRVLERAATDRALPSDTANRMADELAVEPHPIWGHRGHAIIEALRFERWHDY